jgi:transposase InsO family protein
VAGIPRSAKRLPVVRQVVVSVVYSFGVPRDGYRLLWGGLSIEAQRFARRRVLGRRRKKIPVADRQPLIRPASANEVWSIDFVFDRVAGGRMLKCLVIVDDATHECVAIVVEHTIGGDHLTRILDSICSLRGKPLVIRSDNVLRANATQIAGNSILARNP